MSYFTYFLNGPIPWGEITNPLESSSTSPLVGCSVHLSTRDIPSRPSALIPWTGLGSISSTHLHPSARGQAGNGRMEGNLDGRMEGQGGKAMKNMCVFLKYVSWGYKKASYSSCQFANCASPRKSSWFWLMTFGLSNCSNSQVFVTSAGNYACNMPCIRHCSCGRWYRNNKIKAMRNAAEFFRCDIFGAEVFFSTKNNPSTALFLKGF